MSGLAHFLKSRQDKILDSDPLRGATDAFFRGEKRGETALFSLASHCAQFSINTPEDLIEYYRTFLSLLFQDLYRFGSL